ncbi:MAG: hypothetical protein KDD03_12785, partial [Gelidibacter sp.]|nr:hypothetical protein [Gelidibacter sp.]
MIKNYSLVLIAFLCFVVSGFGQVTIYSESMFNGVGGSSGDAIATHESNNRFNEDGLTYSGTGDMRTTNVSSGYTGASGSWNVMLNANTESFIMDGLNITSYSSNTLSLGIRKSTTAENGSGLIIEYSTTGSTGAFTSLSWGNLPTGTGTATWHLVTGISIPNNITTLRFRSTNTVEWRLDDINVIGTLTSTATADYCNLQNPQNGTVEAGEPFNVQARVYEGGLTDTTNGMAAPGISAWIGYSTTNATTTADFNTASWTWVPATFLAETNGGNNDEYQADLGAAILTPGTYYYVSRFSVSSGPYTYGGFDIGGGNGFWDTTNDVSGVLTVTPAILDFYNLQFPQNGSIITGGTYDVYAQAYEAGVTEAAGRGNDVVAWIGYSTTNATSVANFSSAAWTWVPAPYFGQAGTGNNNDEFRLNLGAQIGTPGTYYYVSRFQYNSGALLYGGFDTGGGNGAWD